MVLELEDWKFQVDIDSTLDHTIQNSKDHCECGYCRNFYEAMPVAYPEVCSYLTQFGVDYRGPSEVIPFEPTMVLVCYRVSGSVLNFGSEALCAGQVSISVEMAEDNSFFLWVGEVELPWLQQEDPDEVVSPANLPEFLERMEEIWLLRHGPESIQS